MIKKLFIIFGAALLLVSCSSKEAENEQIRKELEAAGAPGTGVEVKSGPGGNYPTNESRRPPGKS